MKSSRVRNTEATSPRYSVIGVERIKSDVRQMKREARGILNQSPNQAGALIKKYKSSAINGSNKNLIQILTTIQRENQYQNRNSLSLDKQSAEKPTRRRLKQRALRLPQLRKIMNNSYEDDNQQRNQIKFRRYNKEEDAIESFRGKRKVKTLTPAQQQSYLNSAQELRCCKSIWSQDYKHEKYKSQEISPQVRKPVQYKSAREPSINFDEIISLMDARNKISCSLEEKKLRKANERHNADLYSPRGDDNTAGIEQKLVSTKAKLKMKSIKFSIRMAREELRLNNEERPTKRRRPSFENPYSEVSELGQYVVVLDKSRHKVTQHSPTIKRRALGDNKRMERQLLELSKNENQTFEYTPWESTIEGEQQVLSDENKLFTAGEIAQ